MASQPPRDPPSMVKVLVGQDEWQFVQPQALAKDNVWGQIDKDQIKEALQINKNYEARFFACDMSDERVLVTPLSWNFLKIDNGCLKLFPSLCLPCESVPAPPGPPPSHQQSSKRRKEDILDSHVGDGNDTGSDGDSEASGDGGDDWVAVCPSTEAPAEHQPGSDLDLSKCTLPQGAERHTPKKTHKKHVKERRSNDFLQGYELMYAAGDGCLKCTKALIESGVSVNYASKSKTYNPLEWAIWGKQQAEKEGDIELQRRCVAVEWYLIKKGAMRMETYLARHPDANETESAMSSAAAGSELIRTSTEPAGVWASAPDDDAN